MINKRLALTLLAFILMLIPLGSALTLTDPSTWDDTVKFHETSENGKYGYYEIGDTFLWIFNKQQIKTVELLENSYSVLTGKKVQQIELFKSTKLFDRTDYYAKDKETNRNNAIKSELHYYRKLVNNTYLIKVNGKCLQENTITNGTNSTTYCLEYEDLSYEETREEWTEWEMYNFGAEQPGIYQVMTIVQRVNQYTGIIDWIDTSEGHKLKEWAAWWDSNWLKKREISSLNGTISALYNISYFSGQTDFDDIRFLDFATESVELNYSIISKVDGVSAMVRVNNLNQSEIMYYYDNLGASPASSFDNLYWSPIVGYTFDNGNANDDTTNGNDGTITGATLTNSGYIGRAYDFNGGSDYIDTDFQPNPTEGFTVNIWFKTSDTGGGQQIASQWGAGSISWKIIMHQTATGKIRFATWDGSAEYPIDTAATYNDGNWHMATLVWDGTGGTGTLHAYIDGNEQGSGISADIQQATTDIFIGANNVAAELYAGTLDEFSNYVYALTSDQITDLYYSNAPSFVVGAEQTNVGTTLTQLFPTNALTTDEQLLNYTYNITTEGLNFTNTTLFIWNDTDDTLELTNFTSLSGNTSQIISWDNTLSDGNWKWNAEICDSSDVCVSGSNRTLTINTIPFIEFISPTPDNNSQQILNSFTVAVNLTEKYFDSLTFNLYNDSEIVQTKTIAYPNLTRQHTFTNILQGLYNFNATISTNTSQTNSTEVRQILVHLGLPEVIIFDPSGFQGSIIIGENETLNYSIIETGQNLSTHLVECWFEYNNTEVLNNISFTPAGIFADIWVFPSNYANVTVVRDNLNTLTNIPATCSRQGNFTLTSTNSGFFDFDWLCLNESGGYSVIGTVNSQPQETPNITAMQKRPLNCTGSLESFRYVEQKNGLCVHAIDEFGLHAENVTTWNYEIEEVSQTFNNQTTEGAIETFEATIILDPSFTISAVAVVYNGTGYVGSSSTSGGIITLETSSVLIPSVITETNFTFNWVIILSDSTIINLSTQNQTVLNLELDNCSSFSNILFNFTSKDEEMQTQLSNTTKEVAINVYSEDRSIVAFNVSAEYSSNPTAICLNENLTSGISYSLDAIIRYEAAGYANEYYNIVDFNLNSESVTQKITLYNINSSDATEFQLTFKGDDFLPVEDALVFVERQYIAENTFKTVELPKTDSNGQTVLHLVRNEIIYNIIVMKDGEVLGTFTNLIAFCDDFSIGDCKIILNAIEEESSAFDYNEQIGIVFSNAPMYNETTNIVSFSFVSVDGTSKNVQIDVERRDIFGNTSVCTNILVATSGTIFCNVGNITDTTLVTSITVDGEEWIIAPVQIDSEAYGSIGYVATFFLTLILMFYLGDSKNGVMLAVGIGYIVAVSMGFMIGGIIGAGTAGIWMIVLTVLGLYQINKNKT